MRGRDRELVYSDSDGTISYTARSDERTTTLELFLNKISQDYTVRIALTRPLAGQCPLVYRFDQLTQSFIRPQEDDLAWLYDFYKET